MEFTMGVGFELLHLAFVVEYDGGLVVDSRAVADFLIELVGAKIFQLE